MFLQPNSDQAFEGDSSPILTTNLIIQSVSTCVQYEQRKQSRWFTYIAIGVFIWRTKTRSRLRKAKAKGPFHQRFLNKVACINVRQNVSHLSSYFKNGAAYIPLLTPTPTTPPAAVSNHVIEIPLQEPLLNDIARIVREKDLNALQERGGVDGVSTLLSSHFEDCALDGGQVRQPAWKTTKPVFFHFLLKACNQYTIFFLFVSAGLQFAIEFMKQGVKQGWHDGFAILVAMLLLIAFPSIGNYRNERKICKNKR